MLPPDLPAQTATWIGPVSLTTFGDWSTPANWDTGSVPNSPATVAIIVNSAVSASYPTGGIRIFSTTVDLAELRLSTSDAGSPDSRKQPVVISGPNSYPTNGGILNLHGAGIRTVNSAGADPRYSLRIGAGSQLHFYNAAAIIGSGLAIAVDDAYFGFSGSVDFHDQSSAGEASIFYLGSAKGSITFHDRSTAGMATLGAHTLTFTDQANAGNSRITTYYFGTTVQFRDQANAGHASILLGRYGSVIFADQADAGTATVSCSLESAGGVIIRDQAITSGLTVASIKRPGEMREGGRLDISQAAGGVRLRGLDGGVQVNLGANTLTLGPAAGDQKLGGAITGTGGLVLDTGRVVRITRSDNTYTGPTDVRSGSLQLESGRISATTVAAPATLVGTGTIAGDLLNEGLVRPATPGQPLSVQGNFTQTGSGALAVRLVSPGSYDQLAVAGTATLDGTLLLSIYESLPSVGNARYAILTAQGLAGAFASIAGVPSDLPMLHYRLAYTPRDVALEVVQQSFADAALTPAQRALGTHLDTTLDSATGGYRSILLQLNTRPATAEVVAGLSRLVPDRYAVLSEEAFSAAAGRQAALDRRLASLRQSRTADRSAGVVFFEGGRRRTTYSADHDLAEVEFQSRSGLAGAAWSRDRWTFGATVAAGRSSAELDRLGSNMQVRSVAPGLFVQYASGALFLHATATTNRDDYRLRRDSSLVGYSATTTARTDGSRNDFAFTVGGEFTRGGWSLTPFLGLLHSRFKVDDFTETLESGNPGAEMAVTGWSVRSLRSRAGFDLVYRSPSGVLLPRLGIGWLHEFERDRGFDARFAAAPAASAYRVPGRTAETDLVQAALGVDWLLGRRLVLSVSAGLAEGRHSRATADLSASLRWSF